VQVPGEPALHCASALHVQAPAMQKDRWGKRDRRLRSSMDPIADRAAGALAARLAVAQADPPLHEQTSAPVTALHPVPSATGAPPEHTPVVGSHVPVEAPTRQLTLSTHPHWIGTPPQTNPAPCARQSLPQLPQLEASWLTVRSHPSSGPVAGRSQLPNPSSHAETQKPAAHSRESTCKAEQARPHAPQ
jgi:hypothetical protein